MPAPTLTANPAPARLTRAQAAKLPKVSPAVSFLVFDVLAGDDTSDSDDDAFDPEDGEDSFLSDDEPDAVIPLEEFDPKNRPKMVGRNFNFEPTEPDHALFERRAAEIEAQYQAALADARARSTGSLTASGTTKEEEMDGEVDDVNFEAQSSDVPVEDVTREVNDLTLHPRSSSPADD